MFNSHIYRQILYKKSKNKQLFRLNKHVLSISRRRSNQRRTRKVKEKRIHNSRYGPAPGGRKMMDNEYIAAEEATQSGIYVTFQKITHSLESLLLPLKKFRMFQSWLRFEMFLRTLVRRSQSESHLKKT